MRTGVSDEVHAFRLYPGAIRVDAYGEPQHDGRIVAFLTDEQAARLMAQIKRLLADGSSELA